VTRPHRRGERRLSHLERCRIMRRIPERAVETEVRLMPVNIAMTSSREPLMMKVTMPKIASLSRPLPEW
jgi:hypothetical protein